MNLECVVEEKVVFDVKSRKIVEKIDQEMGSCSGADKFISL